MEFLHKLILYFELQLLWLTNKKVLGTDINGFIVESNLTTADVAASTNKNYVSDVEILAFHGVNDENSTSNSYADGKVANEIVDGITTIAPSQNAVFDALTGKQPALSGTISKVPYYSSTSELANSNINYLNGNLGINKLFPEFPIHIGGSDSSLATLLGNADVFEIENDIDNGKFSVGTYQNFLLQVESLGTTPWTKVSMSATITNNNAIAPSGFLLAEQIPAGDNVNGELRQSVTNSTLGNFVFSIWLKSQSGNVSINLQIDSNNESGIAKTVSLTEKWQRFYVTTNFTVVHTTKIVRLISGMTPYVAWGAQLETGTNPRVYGTAITTTAQSTLSNLFTIRTAISIQQSAIFLSTITSYTTIASSIPFTTDVIVSGFLSQAASVSSAVTVNRQSPSLVFMANSWNTTPTAASKTQTLHNYLIPYSGLSTAGRLNWRSTSVNGVAENSDLMSLDLDGNGLSVLGKTFGAECLTNPNLTSGTSWSATDDYTLSSDRANYTNSIGSGTLTQTQSTLATQIKSRRWYRFVYTISSISSASTTFNSYIPNTFAERQMYINNTTNGTYTLYFKTAPTPTNFQIITTSAGGGSFILGTFSLMEVLDGDITACGKFTGGGTNGLKILSSGDIAATKGTYNYNSVSDSADTIGDTRKSNQAGIIVKEICTAASATKGAGTWEKLATLDISGIHYFNSAIQYRDEYPSGQWVNASGGAAPDEVSVTIAGVATRKQAFDGATTTESKSNMFEIAHDFAITAVNAGTEVVEFHIHGMPSTNAAGTARFTLDWNYAPTNAFAIAMASVNVDFIIATNSQYKHSLAAVNLPLPAGGYIIGGKIDFALKRVPTDAADTYTDDFLFDKCALHIPLDSIGSNTIYGKY